MPKLPSYIRHQAHHDVAKTHYPRWLLWHLPGRQKLHGLRRLLNDHASAGNALEQPIHVARCPEKTRHLSAPPHSVALHARPSDPEATAKRRQRRARRNLACMPESPTTAEPHAVITHFWSATLGSACAPPVAHPGASARARNRLCTACRAYSRGGARERDPW